MGCDEVRDRLPDHLLGALPRPGSDVVDAHLRGCASCRGEAAALGDGLAAFASAAHDRQPPDALADRVREVLQTEWSAAPAAPTHRLASEIGRWLATAAAIVALIVALAWGLSERHHAAVASANGESYVRLLQTLGGKEFRAGTLTPASSSTLAGSVVIYESHQDQSWAAVFLRGARAPGRVLVTLDAPDGRTITMAPIHIGSDGNGSSWLVTSADLSAFDHLIIHGGSGNVIATAQIQAA
jgi:predicted anti-sigma-YlaC factor YlaD